MAGVIMPGDEGTEVTTQGVPAIGGKEGRAGLTSGATAPVVASAHLTDDNRANGVAYPAEAMTSLDGGAYPAGTDFGESSNPLR